MQRSNPSPAEPPTPKRREEGAVLLIVLLVLLVVTATGTYTVRATTAELQGAGAMRTAVQTESIAVAMTEAAIAWTDRDAPISTLKSRMDADRAANGNLQLDVLAEPVALAANTTAGRFTVAEFSAVSNATTTRSTVMAIDGSSLNGTSATTPRGSLVDIYDLQLFPARVAGERVDGGAGQPYYARMVVVARARTELPPSALATAIRDLHVTTATTRAVAIIGPEPMPSGSR